MQQTSVESSVLVTEEPPPTKTGDALPKESDDPLLRIAGVSHAERCGGDCRTCRAGDVIKLDGVKVAKFHSIDVQQRFTRQALGIEATGAEYTVGLFEQEQSLRSYQLRLAGCHAAVNGTRKKLATMLNSAAHVLDEKLNAEKALYVNDWHFRHPPAVMQETENETVSPAIDEAQAVEWVENLRSVLKP
jgi:hypothetical protein